MTPIALATMGRITGAGIQPIALATRGRLTLLVVPVRPPVVLAGAGDDEDGRPEPRRMRLLREDDDILAVIMAIHGETTWRA